MYTRKPTRAAPQSQCTDSYYPKTIWCEPWYDFLESVLCLHVICKATRWSETAVLPSNRLQDQISAFKRIQIFHHGAPRRIHSDNQYNKEEFLRPCDEIGANFIASAANDHEANGAIESANRTLRAYFRRLRAVNAKSDVREILA